MDKKRKINIFKILIPVFIIIILITIIFSGPRVKLKKNIKEINIPNDINKLNDYIINSEKKIKNLKIDTEKKIIWANNENIKTKYAIVYIHGFSATRKEISPVIENLGKKLNANIFFTRLKAHGRDAEAFKDVSANDWINDTNEAVEIGKKIGDKLVIIASSTGAILTLDKITNEPNVKIIVLLSPNFGLKDKRSNIVFYPWGKNIAKLINGSDYFEFESENEDEEYYWTRKYHINGFFEMMSLINYSKKIKYNEIKIPCLTIFTENDKIIDIENVFKIYYKIGSKSKKVINLKEAEEHVLTGNIKSPQTTDKTINIIYDYISNSIKK